MSALVNLVGQRFGRLLVLDRVPTNDWQGTWRCKCDCGAIKVLKRRHLRRGTTRSCGCLRRESLSKIATRHGMRGSAEYEAEYRKWYESHCRQRLPEYKNWDSMKARCHNPNAISFKYYGARGITVCSEWRDSFEAFREHIGPRPSPKHTIERINNDGHYEPGNVRWATMLEQAQNRRPYGAAKENKYAR